MPPTTVLVLDPDLSTQKNTCFLLRIAGFAVTTVHEVNEALNWITSRQRTLEPCQMLLISNLSDEQIREISRQLEKAAITLPTLLLVRGEQTFRFQPGQSTRQLSPLRVLHHPEQVAATARVLTEAPNCPAAGTASPVFPGYSGTRLSQPLYLKEPLSALSTTKTPSRQRRSIP